MISNKHYVQAFDKKSVLFIRAKSCTGDFFEEWNKITPQTHMRKEPINFALGPPQGFSKHHLIKREEPFSYGKIYFVHFGEVSTL